MFKGNIAPQDLRVGIPGPVKFLPSYTEGREAKSEVKPEKGTLGTRKLAL